MKRMVRICAFALLSGAAIAFAHGNMDHVIGTVTAINGNVVTVQRDNLSTEVVLTPTTTWEMAGQPGKQNELKVGDRVVIHAVKVNGKETAHEVRYAHAGGAK